MRIQRNIIDSSQLHSFSVDNRIISRQGMMAVASKMDGVFICKSPSFLDDDVFCEFMLNGFKFYIIEPYGDGPTYDVFGPAEAQREIKELALLFEQSNPVRGGDWKRIAFKLFELSIFPLLCMITFAITVIALELLNG